MRLMNAFGNEARHTILTAVPGALAARAMIDPGIDVTFPDDAPSLSGKPGVRRYRALAAYMAGFDLILTYNWGSMDAVMTRRLFARHLPPLVHHEDGFNADEVVRLKTERNGFRRIALPAAHAVVVPSHTLETIARTVWRQPAAKLRRIANGIDISVYGRPTIAIPGLIRKKGEIVVGTLAGLRPVKNLPKLVRAAAAVPHVRLVIVGEGDERNAILAEADRCGMADRLVLPGHLRDPAGFVGHFDLFALSSDSEQFPISLIEAMAAGLPVVATDVGDVSAMVTPENQRFIVPVSNEQGFHASLAKLAGDAALRRAIGVCNQARARAEFAEAGMIAAYRQLYEGALANS